MSECRCLKITISGRNDGEKIASYFCCGKSNATTIPKVSTSMAVCITPMHECRAESLIRVGAYHRNFYDRPDFIEFCNQEDRLKTFDNWPKTLKQTPEQMAAAGFFHTQKADRVICFWCGIGLMQWEEDDDAWEQHALYRGDCAYVRLLKTPEYVTSIKVKFAVDEPDISTLFLKD